MDCTDSTDVWGRVYQSGCCACFLLCSARVRADKQAKTIAGIIVAAGALGKVTHAGDLRICGKSILDETH